MSLAYTPITFLVGNISDNNLIAFLSLEHLNVGTIIILLVIAFVVPMVQFFYYVKDE